jgi:hypothetical protein
MNPVQRAYEIWRGFVAGRVALANRIWKSLKIVLPSDGRAL